MSRVIAVVEGQTEQTFVRDVLAPELGQSGVSLSARLVGKPGHKGGNVKWPRVRKDVEMILKSDPTCFCTMMIDYYALPTDWPGRSEAASTNFRQIVEKIEQACIVQIQEAMGSAWDPRRFMPYLQTHEFEALLFSDTNVLASMLQASELATNLHQILQTCGEPEAIDDGPQTAPSKRLINLNLERGYEKVIDGTRIAKAIGLTTIRNKCPHFDQWISQIVALGSFT